MISGRGDANTQGSHCGWRSAGEVVNKEFRRCDIPVSNAGIYVTNAVGVNHFMASKMGIIGFTRGLARQLQLHCTRFGYFEILNKEG